MAERAALARFGARVRRARALNNWTQTELGAKAGMNHVQVSKIEQGRQGARFESIIKLAEAAGVTLDGLLGPCGQCDDSPPPGFICASCLTEGGDGA